MTRVLYLITAHKSPGQTLRLIRALLAASEAGKVLVHYDPTSASLDLQDLESNPRVVIFANPRRVRWGDFSLVESLMRTLRWALSELEFDWVIWISGQDYPLGTLADFESELEHSPYDGYFRHFNVVDHPGWPPLEGVRRYYFRYWHLPPNPYFYHLPASAKTALGKLRRWVNDSQSLVMLRPRQRNNPALFGLRCRHTPFSPEAPCIGGWAWLNIRRQCAEYLIGFSDSNPAYVEHFSHTYCPDEGFPHSVLVNAGRFRFANAALRHVYWGDKRFPSSPQAITVGATLDEALASGNPFARKFDEQIDTGALDVLDERIRRREPAGSVLPR